MSDPISRLGLACPLGGKFYICQGGATQFIGCCLSDPCAGGKGSCPQADLRYASFDAAHYADIKPQACAGKGSWYTCSGQGLKDPFLGCCSSNACGTAASGCPQQDLLAARLSDDKASAAPFSTTIAKGASGTASPTKSAAGISPTSAASTSVTGTTLASASASATVSGTAAAAVQSDSAASSGLPVGARAGIGAGCAVLAVVLMSVVFFFVRRRLRDRKGVVVQGAEPPSPGSNMMRDSQATMTHRYDPNQILWTPRWPRPPQPRPDASPSSSSDSSVPFTPVFAANRPAKGWRRSFSTTSFSTTSTASFSTAGGFNRQASQRSESSNGGHLGRSKPDSPSSDGISQQRLYAEQHARPPPQICAGPSGDYVGHKQQHQLQPLETVAELDGSDVPRPILLPQSTYRTGKP